MKKNRHANRRKLQKLNVKNKKLSINPASPRATEFASSTWMGTV